MMKTFASLFTGCGGADVGAAQAGYRHLWGVEYHPQIAAVAKMNGISVLVGDVMNIRFGELSTPFWLHMSPPCTRASRANSGAVESELDQGLANACSLAILLLRPRRVSLENVWGYRKFEAFRSILATLQLQGYSFDYWHLNAADYGVPQTRKRLILCASLDHQPRRPAATHAKRQLQSPEHPSDQLEILDARLPSWRGWYDAIADLIPSLPDSQFAPWQVERLPSDLRETVLIGLNKSQYSPHGITLAAQGDPSFTVTQQAARLRAFVVHPTNMQSMPVRDEDDPIFTLTAGGAPEANNLFSPHAYVERVVKLTPRCLARFNGFSDDYCLPSSNTLSCTVMGNVVPPGLIRPVIEANT